MYLGVPGIDFLFIRGVLSDNQGKSKDIKINCSRLPQERQPLLDKGVKINVDIV
jgi:hypothetical protein